MSGDNTPQLYVWEPHTHGPLTVSVVETSLERAVEAVNKHIAAERKQYPNKAKYDYEGWTTGGYNQAQVFPIGQVCTHLND